MKNIAYWFLIISLIAFFLYQKGLIFTNFPSITAEEASKLLKSDNNITLIDVRTEKEFKEDGYIKKSKLIPLGALQENLSKIDKSKKVLIYCRSGSRSISAARLLEKNGFEVINLSGGINSWKSSGLDIKK